MNPQTSTQDTGSTARLIIIAIAMLVLLLGGFYIWLNRAKAPELTSAPPAIDRSSAPTADLPPVVPESTGTPVAEEPTITTPSQKPIVAAPATIESSDAQVKLAVADLAPAMAAWLVPDQQLRKWVLAIDIMADGDVPKSYRPLAYPLARFEPEVRGLEPDQQFLLKVESYKRSDLLVNAVVAIDVDHLAHYYQAWSPLLEKAYQEQGKKGTFNQRLRAALQHVIDVKPLTAPPMLKKRGGVIYLYADDKLEAASDVEKMLWRMGPENSLKIQDYLRQLLARLPK